MLHKLIDMLVFPLSSVLFTKILSLGDLLVCLISKLYKCVHYFINVYFTRGQLFYMSNGKSYIIMKLQTKWKNHFQVNS